MPAHSLISHDLAAEAKDYARELESLAVLADEVQHWTSELKQVWPDLELVWAPEHVEHPALVPGRFHIIEHRPLPTPPNVIPLVRSLVEPGCDDPNGYMEPGAWMFEYLRKADHWSERSMAIREDIRAKAESARQRAHQREHEERAAELDDRIKSLLNPGVSFHQSPNRLWSPRAHAPRAKK